MKKIITNLLLAVLLNGLISAMPTRCNCMIKSSNSSKFDVPETCNLEAQQPELEIQPLDMLSFKFQ